MFAVSVLGTGATRAVARLSAAADGRVGIVRHEQTDTDGGVAAAKSETEYVVDDGWHANGTDLSVVDAIDRLAPDHEYAFVVGAPKARLPTVVVGEESGEALVSAPNADVLDPATTIEAIRETEPYETLESLVAAVKRNESATYSGAIATFTGRVRAKEDENDERTRYLEFEKYEGVAEDRIPEGEDIVFVVVLAGHRGEAFTAVEDGINRLKDEVPLFKKEVTDEETFWVHERQ